MPKVSVVMPVYNASRFLDESVNSILNQTLDDLELICVDDGSTDNSLAILKSFTDSRIKVYSRKHEGGGNARNYGLTKITGKYLFCMDADDILDLNAFEDFYQISEDKNLDFVVFKAINYGVEKDHYFETEYQNMSRIYNKVKDDVFSYKDLGDLLFDFNVSPWCKFYNTEFIKNTGAKFRENSKFHDNQFFWDIVFEAERIFFLNKFYYTRKRYNESLTASGDINHINIIGVVNDIIKLFEKHDQLENYKKQLYNLKITWITDRYNQIQEKYKAQFFRKMKNDFLYLKTKEFPNLLDDNRRFLYDCVIVAKNYNDFEFIKRHDPLNKNKKIIDDLNNELTDKEKTIQNLKDYLKSKQKTNNELNDKLNENNKTIQNSEKTINDLKDKLKSKEKINDELIEKLNENNNTIQNLKNHIKNKEKTNTELNKQIQNLEDNIKNKEKTNTELNKQIQNLEDNIKNKEKTNSDLNNQIKNLNNKINKNNNTIQNNEKTIAKIEEKLKNKEKTIEKLDNIIISKYQIIDDLNNQINYRNEIIKENSQKISKLEIENVNLTKNNDYLKNELENKFSLKKILKTIKIKKK